VRLGGKPPYSDAIKQLTEDIPLHALESGGFDIVS
jgi:hypothetical protein